MLTIPPSPAVIETVYFIVSVGVSSESSLEQEKNIKSEKRVSRFIKIVFKTNLKNLVGCIFTEKFENLDFESCNHIFVINNQSYHIVKQYFTTEMKTKKRSKMTSCL